MAPNKCNNKIFALFWNFFDNKEYKKKLEVALNCIRALTILFAINLRYVNLGDLVFRWSHAKSYIKIAIALGKWQIMNNKTTQTNILVVFCCSDWLDSLSDDRLEFEC